ncbi:uncharacterized protein LOC144438082 [Glandiceps talaboti]
MTGLNVWLHNLTNGLSVEDVSSYLRRQVKGGSTEWVLALDGDARHALVTFQRKYDADNFIEGSHGIFKKAEQLDDILWNVRGYVAKEYMRKVCKMKEDQSKGIKNYDVDINIYPTQNVKVSGRLSSLRKLEKLLTTPQGSTPVFDTCHAMPIPYVTSLMTEGNIISLGKQTGVTITKDRDGTMTLVSKSLDGMNRLEEDLLDFCKIKPRQSQIRRTKDYSVATYPGVIPKDYTDQAYKVRGRPEGLPTLESLSTQDVNMKKCLAESHFTCKTTEGIQISIYRGDITREKADVIVNSANHELRHERGVALALLQAAGSQMQRDCDDYVRRHGLLSVCQVCCTSPGRLNCKHIMHVVGPVWEVRDSTLCANQLSRTIWNMLREANHKQASSLVTPMICSGIHGVPLEICATVFRKTLDKFSTEYGMSMWLRHIKIVNDDPAAVTGFIVHFVEKSSRDVGGTVAGSSSNRDWSSTRPSKPPCSKPNVGSGGSGAYDTGNMRSKQSFDLSGAASSAASVSSRSTSTSTQSISPSLTTQDIASSSGRGDCQICTNSGVSLKSMKCCKNTICTTCFDHHFGNDGKCPFCTLVVFLMKGNQPFGKMDIYTDKHDSLEGYEGKGVITITYNFSDGTQGKNHPNPGKRYSGTTRRAYLPANSEGQSVLKLLKRAFDMGLLFTIGKSVTTGQDNCVVWNDVHHKTSKTGGPARYGYPDPTYLRRVKEELAAKGIK